MNRYYNPVRLIEGKNCTDRLPGILRDMKSGGSRVLLLLWSESVLNLPVFSELAENRTEFDVRTHVFSYSNPTVEQLFELYRQTREFFPDAVVAVGGGSVLDAGKALCCLYGRKIESTDGLRDLISRKDGGVPKTRWIGIPTTSGTGSETTCWATIWDPSEGEKRSVENHENYAYAALVDPVLTEHMPRHLAVSSALDAMAHAVESYWAKGTNCVSRALSLDAVRIIMGHMEDLLSGGEEAGRAMAEGSMIAGLAFSNTKTTACHSISYPLTMQFGIPHGAAVGMLLAPVLRMNQGSVKDLSALLRALGVPDAGALQRKITSFLRRGGLPATLREWGVKRSDLEGLAAHGMTRGRADNNPVRITSGRIEKILEEIYSCEPDQIVHFRSHNLLYKELDL